MPGAGVEPPAPPAEAVAAAGHRLRPSRVSVKRSWPPGCGRFPAPPPAPASAAAAGLEVNGVDGASTVVGRRVDEADAPAVISPSVQNGRPDKVEEAVATATVSPVRQKGAPPHQQDRTSATPAPVLLFCVFVFSFFL